MKNSFSARQTGFDPSLSFNIECLPVIPGLTLKHVAYLARCAAYHFGSMPQLDIKYNTKNYYFETQVYGIVVRSKVFAAIYQRVSCPRFWKRAIENKENEARINLEAANSVLGGPTLENAIYCSNETLERVKEKKKTAEEQLSRLTVKNLATGSETDMWNIAKRNERNRINQLYNATINIEKLATELSYRWIFITLTAPPKYHPNPLKGKCSYDPELGVKASHLYINGEWKKIRSRLAKKGLSACPNGFFGVRTVEPHKDGCVHWHVLVFIDRKNIETLSAEVQKSFPLKYQCEIVIESPKEGSATAATYLYKYISKSFSKETNEPSDQGHLEDQAREERDLASYRNKERVQAALSCLKIRQYDTFGLRRLTTIIRLINKLDLATIDAEPGSALDFVKTKIWRNSEGLLNLLKVKCFNKASTENTLADTVRVIKRKSDNSYGEPTQRMIGVQIGDRQFLNSALYKIERR
jgi:hypothetical protein